jgi:hypothetical protein
MLKPDEEQSFFDRERDRLTGEIATVRVPFYCHRDRVSSVASLQRILNAFPFFLRNSKSYYRAAIS